ncbi:MAG TPA: hypothetical protein VLF69_04345 [Candidatus Saccharimonadales bacterium]|nr:hypothetical protein [Candidatus Saccharimonadales bacterium]
MTDYYQQVVQVTEEFLGPAAERFVKRQIEFGLGKPPETIDRGDLPKLKETLGIALGLLVKDQEIVNQAMRKFDLIAETTKE